MSDIRKKNKNWQIPTNSNGTTPLEYAQLAVLMDIRDELQRLNTLFRCPFFTRIPMTLNAIRLNTARKRRKPAKEKAK